MRRALLVFLLLAATPLAARELHWESIAVTARLNGDGSLRVVERQRFIFSGDWNGGERTFRIAAGQHLKLRSVRRINAAGGAIELKPGDVAAVDRYSFDGEVLRWRSRLPSDPPFDNTPLTYELDYELSNVLIALGGERYLLSHNFAFPNRPGTIDRFTLELTFDEAWRGVEPRISMRTKQLLPGESLIVRRELTYGGTAAPGTAYRVTHPLARYLAIAIVALGIPIIMIMFVLHERERGRFVRPRETIDEAWLEEHVLSELPEVIGYMYDLRSGPPEVAAILARMTQDGRIESTVTKRWFRAPLLRMTLHTRERELLLQEQQLVRLFFIDGSDETDTDRIRRHYKKKGFNPGAAIENALAAQAARNVAWKNDTPRPRMKEQRKPLIIAGALLVAGSLFGWPSFGLMLFIAALGGIACAAGRNIATHSSDRIRALSLWLFVATLPTLIVAALFIKTALNEVTRIGEIPFLIAAIFLVSQYRFVLTGALTEQSSGKMLLRARLHTARRWFAKQLRKRNPQLRDEWAPYLLALGLGRNVDRWFSSFGGDVAVAATGMSSSIDSSVAASSSVATWSGGGGAFGGAGSSGSWTSAATSLASGSSAPSDWSGSSGSDGGGSSDSGGGGGDSGGGGGGGW